MFSGAPKDNPSPGTKEESVIARGLSLTGEMAGNGTVRLDGNYNGSITCDHLIIGESGHMDGTVKADSVLIQGSMAGEIRAKQVTLTKTASVTGNVFHHVLEVEAGAKVEGRYSRALEKADVSAKLVSHNKGKLVQDGQAAPKLPLSGTDKAAPHTGNTVPAAE